MLFILVLSVLGGYNYIGIHVIISINMHDYLIAKTEKVFPNE